MKLDNVGTIESPEAWLWNYFEPFSRTCSESLSYSNCYFVNVNVNVSGEKREIIRIFNFLFTFFRLPEPLASAEKAEHQMYDEAHASIEDCQQQFPKCKESVWNSKYM